MTKKNKTSNFVSRRRTNSVSGFVNFPINDPALSSDNQGGTFVRLVVFDQKQAINFQERWMVCCGGYQNFVYDETFLGDDGLYDRNKNNTKERFHFPWLFSGENHSEESIPYLCILTLGSTGWSNTDWKCTFDDLSDEGKELYKLIQKLYTDCQLYLLTFLDA